MGADISGRLLRRYKRFFADVQTDRGDEITVHCPNPGSMRGCLEIGAAVRCTTSDNPRRKLRHTLEMIRLGRVWVGLHTLRANQLAAGVLENAGVAALGGYSDLQREVPVGEGTRLDFRLTGHPREPDAYVEVKSVTMAEGTCARFPDSVTARGRRHAERLEGLARSGLRAAVLFVVQRGDCERVEPADDLDPEYGAALRRAARHGVELYAVRARVGPQRLRVDRELPVCL
ncbi:MAG: DNA/RNA nuclease SfsA [Myxococcales bacterium]|nr:DNA/RNA nuclease SfsA [Myxococcales bacterium]